MVLNPSIINHTLPAVSVVVADSSTGVTYSQIRNSLGNQVYKVKGLYLYSDNQSQLIGSINYSRYTSTGDKDVTNIITTIDPYQFVGSIIIDLKDKTGTDIIFNGQSSISTVILPNTYVQIQFIADRTTNSFGMNLNNFNDMQIATNTKFFEDYGTSISHIQESNKLISENINMPVSQAFEITDPKEPEIIIEDNSKFLKYNPLYLLGILALTYVVYQSQKQP